MERWRHRLNLSSGLETSCRHDYLRVQFFRLGHSDKRTTLANIRKDMARTATLLYRAIDGCDKVNEPLLRERGTLWGVVAHGQECSSGGPRSFPRDGGGSSVVRGPVNCCFC